MHTSDRKHIFKQFVNGAIVLLGCIIYALSYNIFLRGNSIIPGGLTGIATIISIVTGFSSTGVLIIIMNIPLFAFSFKRLGLGFILWSLFGTVASSVLIDLLSFLPTAKPEPLLATLFGGVLNGLGLGLIFSRGATTGGSDIAARLLKLRFRDMSIGSLGAAVNLTVILLAGIVLRDMNAMLYAAVLGFTASVTTDKIVYGNANAIMAYIITNETGAVSSAITQCMRRGCTILDGVGAYTGKDHNVLLCAVKKHEVSTLKGLVLKADPAAFVIVTQAKEVLGRGFGEYSERSL